MVIQNHFPRVDGVGTGRVFIAAGGDGNGSPWLHPAPLPFLHLCALSLFLGRYLLQFYWIISKSSPYVYGFILGFQFSSHSGAALIQKAFSFSCSFMLPMLCTGRNRTIATLRPSSSAEQIADDVLIQILRRLPVKSLLKFKSVSKYWRSLISSSEFSRLRNPNPVSGLFMQTNFHTFNLHYTFLPLYSRLSTPPPLSSLSFVEPPARVRILQSCNGFLLCGWRKSGAAYDQKYYICNPTTQQFILLPEFDVNCSVVGIGIAFDPSKSLYYKVVCLRRYGLVQYRYRIEIYSSESRLWNRSQSVDLFLERFSYVVFRNGAIHWIYEDMTGNSGIFSFDVNQERVRELPVPEIPAGWDQRRIIYFGESRNHLYLILHKDHFTAQFNVYEMPEDCSEWFVKHKVPNFLNKKNVPRYTSLYVLCLVREENGDSFLVMSTSIPVRSITCYRLEDDTIRKLRDLSINFDWYGRQPHQFIEALAYAP